MKAQYMQSCIAHLQNTAGDLNVLAGSVTNPEAKQELQKACASLNACLQECRTALDKLGQPT
ncbi:hypothetical protein [Candidatus Desulforudis audaxviator]|uniref:hypothetical protein n=1 Tax=Candidatus Desulforudis audaxviator TaxID=471827 RepID=UPI000313F794|nr:hypothetical protein [Candidatus Desulforudis audaxviator]AZK60055.1 hypothetical protein Daudx_1508 [Candidatus Desulforudis audaxviator]